MNVHIYIYYKLLYTHRILQETGPLRVNSPFLLGKNDVSDQNVPMISQRASSDSSDPITSKRTSSAVAWGYSQDSFKLKHHGSKSYPTPFRVNLSKLYTFEVMKKKRYSNTGVKTLPSKKCAPCRHSPHPHCQRLNHLETSLYKQSRK